MFSAFSHLRHTKIGNLRKCTNILLNIKISFSQVISKQEGKGMATKKYRFSREDFGPLTFYPQHYDLTFDIRDTYVRVIAKQSYIYLGKEPSSRLSLNSHNLTIHSVGQFKCHKTLGKPVSGIDAVPPNFIEHVDSLSDLVDVEHKLDESSRMLEVNLLKEVNVGEEIVIQTVSTCFPNDHDLEGVYYDYTPKGAPQTMITQCQQYGFQKIVPCIDRMIAKLFYTTTIVADTRYTNLISNGDLADGYFDSLGAPKYHKIEEIFKDHEKLFPDYNGPERHVLKYYNHKVNMAPYLFFLGVGTYEVYRKTIEYPDGDSFLLELVCFPDIVKKEHAEIALQSLHDSILWIFISLGSEAYSHLDEENKIYSLIKERESIKKKLAGGSLIHRVGDEEIKSSLTNEEIDNYSRSLATIRGELKELLKVWNEHGYKYTGTCYREIAMENSNYGGMENVGNTTILSSRLTPTDWISDPAYIYMEGVKTHEFYHNINGSQVTGASPFEIWLNEAVTVHVERQCLDHLYGHDFMRLRHLQYALTPGSGPLAKDRSPVSMAVEPIGFNTTHELISAMTYSKAPEFVQMVELILGKINFSKALASYHNKYAFSNATTSQWIAEMAKFAPENIDLPKMAKGWLNRTGYPTVIVKNLIYNEAEKEISVEFEQTGFNDHENEEENYPWIVPINWSLVKNSKNIHDGVFILSSEKDILKISNVLENPDFISVARDWSFYGDIKYEISAANESQRLCQALSDPDACNRFLAIQAILDDEKANLIQKLLNNESTENLYVNEKTLSLFLTIFEDENLLNSTRTKLLTISESVSNYPELSHHYHEISKAKRIIQQNIFDKFGEKIFTKFNELFEKKYSNLGDGIADRMFMSWCFSILQSGIDKPSIGKRFENNNCSELNINLLHYLEELLFNSDSQTNRTYALTHILQLYNISDEKIQEILDNVQSKWTSNPIGCEQYISAISCSSSHRTEKYIRELLDAPFFNMSLAGHARTVARGWTSDRKTAVLTEEGLKFTIELFLKVGHVNQMSAYGFFDAFSDLHKFDENTKQKLTEALHKMQDGLDAKKHESLFNQLNILLSGKK